MCFIYSEIMYIFLDSVFYDFIKYLIKNSGKSN